MKNAENDQKTLLEALFKAVPFHGWTAEALTEASEAAFGSKTKGLMLFPEGISGAIDYFAKNLDTQMAEYAATESFNKLKIREKIKQALMFRLRAHQQRRESIRRLLTYYAMPQHAVQSARHLLTTVDKIWYLAGDTATDYNYYTKRALLAGVYSSTLLAWLTDSTPDLSLTEEFLDRRIADVMKIETAKRSIKEAAARLRDLPQRIFG